MLKLLRPAVVLFLALSIVTGILYPLAITAIAHLAFKRQATGSIISTPDSAPIGSSLIGQDFSAGDPAQSAKWFWGRPSATSPAPFTPLDLTASAGSSGSNLAPTNPALIDNITSRIAALQAAEAAVGLRPSPSSSDPPLPQIPIDLLTASASGLDPHISPAAAEYQIPRIARARNLPESTVRDLVHHHTTPRTLSLLGEPTVNVLELNLELQSTRPAK